MNYTVRGIQAKDATKWSELYNGYRNFYKSERDDKIVAQTWDWVLTKKYALSGLVAVDESDTPIGLANLRWFARPDTSDHALYLDDLFVDPAHRGKGIAKSLLEAASEIAKSEGANTVTWITAEDNTTARSLYDSLATATTWVTYEMNVPQ